MNTLDLNTIFQVAMTDIFNNEREQLPGSKPATPVDVDVNQLGGKETEYINSKAYLLTASTKSGLNL